MNMLNKIIPGKKEKKMHKYNIILSVLDRYTKLGHKLIELKTSYPKIFRENIDTINLHGHFSYCIWSSEYSDRNFIPIEEVQRVLYIANNNNCGIYYDFTNTQLNEHSVYDLYSNNILQVSDKPNFYAVVYNQSLAKYIKEKYSNIKLIKPQILEDETNNEIYDLYISGYRNYLNNTDKILPEAEKYILNLNFFEKEDKELYDRKSSEILEFQTVNYNNYPLKYNNFEELKSDSDFVSLEKLEEIAQAGIDKFLIKNSPNNIYETIDLFIYYLIKEEYHDKARLNIVKSM